MRIGAIHKTNNCGYIEIVDYKGWSDVLVRFVNTGFEITKSASCIRSGRVKDPLIPNIYGVGYFGDGPHKSREGGTHTIIYMMWFNMIRRCYSEEAKVKTPTYNDCTVCEEWHNFQNFAEWASSKDYHGKEIDKDIMVKGNRVYSPDTCCFVDKRVNIIASIAKSYSFISPSGEVFEIFNLADFCRKNNLNKSNMSEVNLGRRSHHKGWTKNQDAST